MSDIALGRLVSGKQERDAVHVAIIPMKAISELRPGQRVGVISYGVAGVTDSVIGIVDPFLQSNVPMGATFWMCLLPNTVTGMRHHWQLAAIELGSASWMQHWADIHLEGDLERAIDIGETMYVGSDEGLGDEIDNEWWDHWEAITGKKSENRGGYFRCAC